MLGVLNTTCKWQQNVVDIGFFPEDDLSTPTYIQCAKSTESKFIQTDKGLIKKDIKYFILHTDQVKTGDFIDDLKVSVTPVLDLSGSIQWYKAVVVDG